MMDRRKSLTISPEVDKGEDLMLPWSQCEGLRSSIVQQDPQLEEVFEDHSQGPLSQCDMVRQPQLVLTDILTTKVGRDYLHKTRHGQEAKVTGRVQGRGARGRASQYSRETWRGGGEEEEEDEEEEEEPGEDWSRCGMMEEGYRDRGEPPGSSLRLGSQDPTAPGRYTQNGLKRRASLPAVDPPTRPLQDRRRSCHQRASEEEEEEEEEDEEDEEVVKMVIVGEEGVNGEEQRCRQSRDRGRSQGGPLRLKEPHPPQFIGAWDTDSGSDAEGNESPVLRCNSRLQVRGRGLSGSWSSRRSVLRLSGETRGPEAGAGPSEGSANPKRLRLDGHGPSDPPGIVMMITGMEEGVGASPVPGSGVRIGPGVRGRRGALRSNPSTSCTVEPIVLSSDDEELSGGVQTPHSSCSSHLQPLGELEPHRAASLQGTCPNPQRNSSWMQRNTPKLIRVSVPNFPTLPPSSSQSNYPSSLPFTHLFWGGVWAQASAEARISAQRIIIPLKGGRGPTQVVLQHPGLWRYSVWEQSDLIGQGLSWKGPPGRVSSPPHTLLLLYLSNAQAVCVQRQLRKLSIKSGPASSADQPSPFLLLSLSSSMEGVEGALCRSNLDILCLGAWPYQAPCSSSHGLAQTPSLTLKESLELINSSDTDDHLLLQLCPSDRSQPETQVLVLDSVLARDEETGDEVLWSDGEKETESHGQLASEKHSLPSTQASIQASTQASIQASTQVSTQASIQLSTQVNTQANIQASTQASIQASSQASSQASTQASSQTSTLASAPASTQASIQASIQAEPKMKSPTDLLTQMGSQTDGLSPEGDKTEPEAGPSIKEGVSPPTPVYTLCHRRVGASYSVSLSLKPDDSWSRHKHRGPARRLIQFPPPPIKGGITVAMEDLECLNNGQFLNDVIIDFYLKYLILEAAPDVSGRSHVFSSFFFKQLTRRDNASEDGSSTTSRQKRHHRVKNWTRHVDIFKKDFLFVPVNQESHWYLVVICFPGLEEPQYDTWACPASHREPGEENSGKPQAEQEASGAKNIISQAPDRPMGVPVSTPSESTVQSPPSPLDCTQMTCHRHIVCKRPCILIMDSLRFSLHERVHKLLREYLQSEWEVRRGSERDFSCDQMSCSHCRVPLQDNSSDCGLYLLQYVQSFLQDPVVHFDLPLCLELWFPRQQVRRKRDEIRDLILRLYRLQRDNGTLGIVGS